MAMSVSSTIRAMGAIQKVVFSWTSAAGGTASGSLSAPVDGEVLGLQTVPDGVAAPSDNYDVTVTDSDGDDVLMGAGADRDTANTEYVQGSSLGAVACDELTLNVSNAGDTKSGVVTIWVG